MAEEQPPNAEEPSPGDDPDETAQRAGDEGAAAERRTLCRSSSDKVIAGVAGGIGAYFGIDSVIVRIAFIILTFLGGAGPFLYLIGWLALPKEDSRSVIAKALGGDSPHRLRSLMAVALIGLGLLITANLSGGLFDLFVDVWSIAPYLALMLIAAGVALVVWPGSAGRHKPTPARPPSTASPPGASPPSSVYATPAPPPPTAAGPEWPTAAPHEPAPAAPPPPKSRDRSLVGWLTVAVLLVYGGSAVMLERLDAFAMDIGVFFAVAVAITGAGLLASAFVRPARGLMVLGVGLCVPLFLFVGADLPWGSGVGEARVRVTAVEELEELEGEYRHGIGQVVVDLRALELDGERHELDLSLGIGEMRVYVPDSVSTTADIKMGVGHILVTGGRYPWGVSDDGLGVSRTIVVDAPDPTGELLLDIDVGIGEAEIVTVPETIQRSRDS